MTKSSEKTSTSTASVKPVYTALPIMDGEKQADEADAVAQPLIVDPPINGGSFAWRKAIMAIASTAALAFTFASLVNADHNHRAIGMPMLAMHSASLRATAAGRASPHPPHPRHHRQHKPCNHSKWNHSSNWQHHSEGFPDEFAMEVQQLPPPYERWNNHLAGPHRGDDGGDDGDGGKDHHGKKKGGKWHDYDPRLQD